MVMTCKRTSQVDFSRSQRAQDQIATDVSVDSHHHIHRPHWNKKKIEVGIFVPVRWSLTGPLIQDFGFQSLISKGHTTAAFWVLLRQHGKARVSWVTQFPQTNARYTVNCFTERLKSFKYSEFSDGLERDCCDRSLTFFKNIWLRRRKTRRWVASNQGFGLRGEIIPPQSEWYWHFNARRS